MGNRPLFLQFTRENVQQFCDCVRKNSVNLSFLSSFSFFSLNPRANWSAPQGFCIPYEQGLMVHHWKSFGFRYCQVFFASDKLSVRKPFIFRQNMYNMTLPFNTTSQFEERVLLRERVFFFRDWLPQIFNDMNHPNPCTINQSLCVCVCVCVWCVCVWILDGNKDDLRVPSSVHQQHQLSRNEIYIAMVGWILSRLELRDSFTIAPDIRGFVPPVLGCDYLLASQLFYACEQRFLNKTPPLLSSLGSRYLEFIENWYSKDRILPCLTHHFAGFLAVRRFPKMNRLNPRNPGQTAYFWRPNSMFKHCPKNVSQPCLNQMCLWFLAAATLRGIDCLHESHDQLVSCDSLGFWLHNQKKFSRLGWDFHQCMASY